MLQIGYMIICEDIVINRDQLLIKKPLPILAPLSLPGNFSFKVAFSLHNLNKEDFGKENNVQLVFKDDEGNIVFDTGELKLQTNINQKPQGSTVEIAEADIGINNVDLFKEGIYTLTLKVNNDSKDLKIPVKARKKQNESS